MINSHHLHFYGRMLRHRPRDFAAIVGRRLFEATQPLARGIEVTHFGDVAFPVDTTLHAITQKYVHQTHEMFLESLFRRHLRPGMTFLDVGANMGYWSAFSAALAGTAGAVHAFEPVPQFFASVARLAASNPRYDIRANNAACGAEIGSTTMQVVAPTAANYDNFNTNIGSSSALAGFLDHARDLLTPVEVDVITLDAYVAAQKIDLDRIGLIKIDVEGYESFCLDGMRSILEKPGARVPLLIEILTDPERHPLLDGRVIVRRLEGHGYRCLDATTLQPLDLEHLHFEENIVCV